MANPAPDADHRKRFPIVGRDSRLDLAKYTVKIHGQDIVDYEKLRIDNPALYSEIVANEFEADRRQQDELEEILADEKESLLYTDRPAPFKYFYLPVFVSNPRQTPEGKYEVKMLAFTNKAGSSMQYASRVLPNQTLSEAVAYDLQKDFKYSGDFQIWAHYFYDEMPDQSGNPLPRIAVLIKVEEFPTDILRPAGMKIHWGSDGAERLREYRFGAK